MKRRISTVAAGALSVIALSVSVAAQAAWEGIPSVSATVEGDDNPRLDPQSSGQTSDSRAVVDLRYTATSYGKRGELVVEPRVRAINYSKSKDSDLNNADLFLVSQARYTFPKSDLGYQASLTRQSIRTGELLGAQNTDTGLPDVGTDTGQLLFFNQIVNRSLVRPYANITLTRRTDLELQSEYVDVFYSGPETTLRSNFQNSSFSFGLAHRPDERRTVSARAFVSDYTAVVNSNHTRSAGVVGGMSAKLSSYLNMSLNLGAVRTAYSFLSNQNTIKNADFNYTVDFALNRRAERTSFNFDLGRQVDPNGSGYVVNRDQVWINMTRDMTRRLQSNAGLRLTRTRAVGLGATNADRDYVRFELSFDWHMKEQLFLTMGYDLTAQRFVDSAEGRVASNTVYFGVGYSGKSRRR